MNKSIGVAVITHNASHHLPFCLPKIISSKLKPKVLVVNSSSSDGTVEKAVEMGAETLVIPRNEFNQGMTREIARKHLATDIVVMMTPDAYPMNDDFLEKLVDPILVGKASISYARQMPHRNAGFFEAFSRTFNYPKHSQIRAIEDASTYGAFTFFCSDTCAAWSSSALDEVGGFFPVLTNEDTFLTALLLKKGHRIAYVSESVVRHSHSYNLMQEFMRHFDNGYVRGFYQKDLFGGLKDERRGYEFVKQLLKEVAQKDILLLPYALLTIMSKYLGYRIGFYGARLPTSIKRLLSGQDYYWSSIYYKELGY